MYSSYVEEIKNIINIVLYREGVVGQGECGVGGK